MHLIQICLKYGLMILEIIIAYKLYYKNILLFEVLYLCMHLSSLQQLVNLYNIIPVSSCQYSYTAIKFPRLIVLCNCMILI